VFAAILIVEQISSDGESHWIEGVQLLSVYAILGILFYYLPDAHHAAESVINGVPATSTPHH
jgi:Ca2+:H+ antiporter